ncbi:hypothetical protein BJV77DRAFT_957025 [Russula vinacea]|nr:hypothetical protein BJV77DRAFT_957025 [Russula vinacea]
MTKKWAGWEGEKGEEQVAGPAKPTKSYGGADLRIFSMSSYWALCTEAALNAAQRRYPQIYKSNDRLLLQPETIEVELRVLMISVKSRVFLELTLRLIHDCNSQNSWPLPPVP